MARPVIGLSGAAVFSSTALLIDSEEFTWCTGRSVRAPAVQGRTELGYRYIRDARWCDANDTAQLVAAGGGLCPRCN